MMNTKKIGIILVAVSAMAICTSAVSKAEKYVTESGGNSMAVSNNEDPNASKAKDFVKRLKNGKSLHSLFSENWTLIYHEDNRCDGSTDGHISNLQGLQADTLIKITVTNDGEGWACDKKEPSTFDMEFSLKSQVEYWDRFEVANYENQEAGTFYILGGGESDYIIIYFNNEHLILKLEYRSEDPG